MAPDGYAGRIRLLVGITPTGTILGVRVLEHQETPGLGIKLKREFPIDFIFSQQQLRSDNLADWAVKKMVANLTSLRAPLSRHAL